MEYYNYNCIYCNFRTDNATAFDEHICVDKVLKIMKTPEIPLQLDQLSKVSEKKPIIHKCNCGFEANYLEVINAHLQCCDDQPTVHFLVLDFKEKLDFGTVTSSKIPQFELIPMCIWEDLAEVFELGEKLYAPKAWNAINMFSNKGHENKEWVRARLAHVIHHTMKALQELNGGEVTGENHAGAIAFGASVLSCYKHHSIKE